MFLAHYLFTKADSFLSNQWAWDGILVLVFALGTRSVSNIPLPSDEMLVHCRLPPILFGFPNYSVYWHVICCEGRQSARTQSLCACFGGEKIGFQGRLGRTECHGKGHDSQRASLDPDCFCFEIIQWIWPRYCYTSAESNIAITHANLTHHCSHYLI